MRVTFCLLIFKYHSGCCIKNRFGGAEASLPPRSRESRKEPIAVIQAGDDGDSHWVNSSRSSEKWSDSGYILKAELTGNPDGLDVWCESSVKNDFKDLRWGYQRD